MIRHIPNRLPNEKIILLLRRHWFVIFARILFWGLASFGPIFIIIMLNATNQDLTLNPVIYAIGVLVTSLYELYIWLFAFTSFVDYYLDVWIVTNERIINIEQKGLFNRVVAEQKLFRIQDVTSELKGFIPTLLNYGAVHVQSAGEKQRFEFMQIPDPNGVARKIITLSDEQKRAHQVTETAPNN